MKSTLEYFMHISTALLNFSLSNKFNFYLVIKHACLTLSCENNKRNWICNCLGLPPKHFWRRTKLSKAHYFWDFFHNVFSSVTEQKGGFLIKFLLTNTLVLAGSREAGDIYFLGSVSLKCPFYKFIIWIFRNFKKTALGFKIYGWRLAMFTFYPYAFHSDLYWI